jgi:hypothetical protein
MVSTARIFFAGIGTTFLIIAAGFGAGLMFAQTALHDTPVQTRTASKPIDPVRMILPTTAEAATAPQPSTAVPVQPVPVAEVKVPEKQIEKVDTRKADDEERTRKRKYAERKARKIAAAKMIEARERQPAEPRIMAFDGNQSRMGGFFGN